MKGTYYRLLRLALSAGLGEREAFVERVSKIVSEKTAADPESGERIARGILSAVEALRDELLLRQIFSDASAERRKGTANGEKELSEKIDRLQRTLDELLQILNGKKS